ncbi:MAG: hypothetical protein HY885_04390 [Deltaproteobacteria bacterium]|nr:hypothetical protein [Deltaproteobacteria bacterium]
MKKRPALLAILLLALLARTGGADQVKVIPQVSIREEYNDNISFAKDAQDDFITTASAGIDLSDVTELLAADLSLRFDGLSYADHDELNDIEQYYKGGLKYQLSQFLKLGAEARYSEDSRPDRDIDITGYVFTADVRRQQNYLLSADYQATEKLALFTSYSYQDDQFEIVDRDEFTGQNVVVGLSKRLDFIKPTAARLYGRYSHYDFYSSKAENYSVTAGFSREVTEKLSYVLDVGPRYTEGSEKRTSDTSNDSGAGGQFTLTYKEELTAAEMNLFHEVSGSGGRDGATERTGLRLSLRHRLGDRSDVRLNIDSFLNTADRSAAFVSDLDELTTTIYPSLHYELLPNLSCEAAYRYTLIDDREGDDDRHRSLVFAKLTYKHPILE